MIQAVFQDFPGRSYIQAHHISLEYFLRFQAQVKQAPVRKCRFYNDQHWKEHHV